MPVTPFLQFFMSNEEPDAGITLRAADSSGGTIEFLHCDLAGAVAPLTAIHAVLNAVDQHGMLKPGKAPRHVEHMV